jgi:hypothetical protein
MDEDLICHQCLNEAYLIRLIRRTGVTAECSFCLKKRKAIPFDDLINMVDDVLQKYCHPGAIYDQYDDNGNLAVTWGTCNVCPTYRKALWKPQARSARPG